MENITPEQLGNVLVALLLAGLNWWYTQKKTSGFNGETKKLQIRIDELKIEQRDCERNSILMRAMFENAEDAIMVVDRYGLIQMANQRVFLLTGWAKDDLVGQPVEKLIPRRSVVAHRHYRESFMESPFMREMGANNDIRILHRTGNEIPVDVSLNPQVLHEGLMVIVTVSSKNRMSLAEMQSRLDVLSGEVQKVTQPIPVQAIRQKGYRSE